VWSETDPIDAFAYRIERRDLTIERRPAKDGQPSYLWATLKKMSLPGKPRKKKGAPEPEQQTDETGDEPISVPEEAATTTTSQFPVGDDGEKAIARLAPLKALRDLGVPDDAAKKDYGLAQSTEKLTVGSGSATRELALGARVFGGNDRYVLDSKSGHAFVVGGEVFSPFDAGEAGLREKRLHGFDMKHLAQATIKAGDKERPLVRVMKNAEADDPQRPSMGVSWADAKTPDKPDQTVTNVMDRMEHLMPIDYVQPDETSLETIASFEYRGKDGKAIGSLSFTKRPSTSGGQVEYFVKTEQTRAIARVNPNAGARIENDITELLK